MKYHTGRSRRGGATASMCPLSFASQTAYL